MQKWHGLIFEWDKTVHSELCIENNISKEYKVLKQKSVIQIQFKHE